ncbi:hypothetical protein VP01_3835g2 [Puccinia sorghi]|uniref:Reverse transcriptase Ty1/copia-type domain-containing protein n=1 Tax=Puccinia sorghi TaxID=27349 RepID=A0A0L6UV25_9BASI|nr:hypothetical protein VP01_3835g2 [Puccinia sorghi]
MMKVKGRKFDPKGEEGTLKKRRKLKLKSQSNKMKIASITGSQTMIGKNLLRRLKMKRILCDDAKYWRQAIEKEVASIEIHDVWENYSPNTYENLTTPKGVNRPTPYLKLKKSLDGLKQSPKNWYETLKKWLNSIGFFESSCDHCLYQCFSTFKCENDSIKISLPNHIQHGLEELGLVNCKTSVTPLTPNLKLIDATDKDHARFKKLNINYQSAIRLFNHIAQLTRPNISFAVSSLARFSVKPGMSHWHEVKKGWQHLKGTSDLKFTLKIKEPNQLLQIFSNASWGDDPKDRTSQSGYLCFLFGTPISWNSSKQRLVTYSSTEAELNPLVDSFHEGIWLKALLAEI